MEALSIKEPFQLFRVAFDFLISNTLNMEVETFNVKNVESVLNILVLYKGLTPVPLEGSSG